MTNETVVSVKAGVSPESVVKTAKRIHYSALQLATMAAVWAMGLVPAYFAINGLLDVSGLQKQLGNAATPTAWVFAIILEIVGTATLKLATEAFIKWYAPDGLVIPPAIPIACAGVYIVDMMLLTTLHDMLPVGYNKIPIALLCIMPVVANVVGGVRSVQDEASATHEHDEAEASELAKEERKLKLAADLEERKLKLESERLKLATELEIMRADADARNQAKLNRSTQPKAERTQPVDSEQVAQPVDKSTDRRKKLLLSYKSNPNLSLAEAATQLDVSKQTVANDLKWFTGQSIIHIEKIGKGQTIVLNGGSEEFLAS
jgi:hypothetical protein